MPATIEEEKTPIDVLLEEQRLMTPVARFSREHERPDFKRSGGSYRDLIPLTKPAEGEQYAFDVDLDACTGCKACVTACHSLNGLEDNETWRDIGALLGGDRSAPFQQTVTTACHHCIDPACLNGCPVLAYEKDPITGIVRHLDDQCIGCQYCVLKCPYDVPKYSYSKGIVRKCDMCHQRLGEGEAPACVQACPNDAIRIVNVPISRIEFEGRRNEGFLPGAPEPDYTLPTTRYRTRRDLPDNIRAADRDTLKPEHAHAPLIVMLVLTQFSVGAFLASALYFSSPFPSLTLTAWIAGMAGLNASLLHLGKPLKAWRAFLGWKTSWLSREIMVFGVFGGAATGAAAAAVLALLPAGSAFAAPTWVAAVLPPGPWNIFACVVGLAGVFCSAMIYHDTRRPFWNLPISGSKFLGTTVLLGLGGAWCWQPSAPVLPALIAAVSAIKLAGEAAFLRHANDSAYSPERKSARMQLYPLRRATGFRFGAGVLGGLIVPGAALIIAPAAGSLPIIPGIALAFLVAGEITERSLFFRAVTAPKMPGGVGG